MQMIFWGILLVVCALLEAITVQLVTIWFAAGSLIALILAAFGCPLWVQVIAFILTSMVLLLFTRPILKKIMVKETIPTNAELNVGQKASVTEEVNNDQNTGRVELSGVSWSARSEDGSVIPAGKIVVVKRMESTTLFVQEEA